MTIKVLYAKLTPPAVQALQLLKLKKIEDLSMYSKESISCLHGIGPNAIKAIEKEMAELGVQFSEALRPSSSPMPDSIDLVDSYIDLFPADVQEKLREMLLIIQNIAPMATEKIAYNVPTFYYLGNLVHFSGSERFVGFNPLSNGLFQFREEIGKFGLTKGFIRFPVDQPLPKKLIEDIVLYRISENKKAEAKKN